VDSKERYGKLGPSRAETLLETSGDCELFYFSVPPGSSLLHWSSLLLVDVGTPAHHGNHVIYDMGWDIMDTQIVIIYHIFRASSCIIVFSLLPTGLDNKISTSNVKRIIPLDRYCAPHTGTDFLSTKRLTINTFHRICAGILSLFRLFHRKGADINSNIKQENESRKKS